MPASPDQTPLLDPGPSCPPPHIFPPQPLISPNPSSPQTSSSHHPAAILRDIIIGFSDGLTVPFALTAGLSSLGDTRLVVMGGLAELCSGMISMGLGAYLAADTERQRWEAEFARCSAASSSSSSRSDSSFVGLGQQETQIRALLEGYGVSAATAKMVVDDLAADRDALVRFAVDFALHLPEPDVSRAWVSGVTMGLSYFVGGLIPMQPYFFLESSGRALMVSVVITVVILLLFGFLKNWVAIRTRKAGIWGAGQTLVVGVVAAGTSWGIVKLLDSKGGS